MYTCQQARIAHTQPINSPRFKIAKVTFMMNNITSINRARYGFMHTP